MHFVALSESIKPSSHRTHWQPKRQCVNLCDEADGRGLAVVSNIKVAISLVARLAYPTDLTDEEWEGIKDLLPPASKMGRPRSVDIREIINAMFYLVDNGIKWRAMPHDFPAWSTVYTYFRRWTRNGLWPKISAILVERLRLADGRDAQPSMVAIDSQSVEKAQKGGLNRVLTVTSASRGVNAI